MTTQKISGLYLKFQLECKNQLRQKIPDGKRGKVIRGQIWRVSRAWSNDRAGVALSHSQRFASAYQIVVFRVWHRIWWLPYIQWVSPHGVMAKVLDCGLKVSEFDLQSHYYVYFRINTLGKGMNPSIPTAIDWISSLLSCFMSSFGIK